jgi:hypothetical protein
VPRVVQMIVQANSGTSTNLGFGQLSLFKASERFNRLTPSPESRGGVDRADSALLLPPLPPLEPPLMSNAVSPPYHSGCDWQEHQHKERWALRKRRAFLAGRVVASPL